MSLEAYLEPCQISKMEGFNFPKTLHLGCLTGSLIRLWTYCLKSQSYTSPEAVVRRCSVKNVFLELSQNSQENICVRVSCLQLY